MGHPVFMSASEDAAGPRGSFSFRVMPCHDVRQAVAALVTTFGWIFFPGFVIYFKKGPLEMTDDGEGDRLIGCGGGG